MAYDDLPLRHTTSGGRPPSRQRDGMSTTSRWIIVGAGAIVAVAAMAFWWMGRVQPQPPATPAPVAAAEPARVPRRPDRQPMELPPLSGSDAMLRELVGSLSRHPLLARLLATRGLVQTATLAMVQIGDGRTPADALAVLRPDSRARMTGGGTGRLDPESYARWDAAARALQSIPVADAAQIYVNVKPLFDRAYRDLGYPEGDFDDAIVRAIRMLEATPAVTTEPTLYRREGYFEHEDDVLRALFPVQKQLILMGPVNRQVLMNWLRQLAAELDLQIGATARASSPTGRP